MASKTTAYANSAIRVFWLNDGNRTHTQSATNFCPTIRLRSTYKRCVLESNQCKRFCRPSPSHSDNSPYCSFSRTRTYTLTFVVLCDNPFHYETNCTHQKTRTFINGFGDRHAAIAPDGRFIFYSMYVSFNLTTLLQNISWNRKTRTFNLSRIRRML